MRIKTAGDDGLFVFSLKEDVKIEKEVNLMMRYGFCFIFGQTKKKRN